MVHLHTSLLMSLPFEHHFVWIVNWIWWTTRTATQVVRLKSHRLICMGTCKRFTKDKKYISRKLFSGIRAKPGVSERVRQSLIRHKRSARAEILEFYPTRPEGNSARPEPEYIVCATRPDPNPNIICPARPEPEYHLCYPTRTRISSVLPDPDPNIICSTQPGPEYHLCYPTRTRISSVLPDPDPNIICATQLGPEYHLFYPTRTRISSVLPDPDPNITRAKCILYFMKRCPYFTFSVFFFRQYIFTTF
jgi:hypothetical protein